MVNTSGSSLALSVSTTGPHVGAVQADLAATARAEQVRAPEERVLVVVAKELA